MWDNIIFGQLPYVLIAIGIVGTIYRYAANRFSWSSQSSEFLENKTLFYGSFPWHYGILIILIMHIVVIFIPGAMLAWNSSPGRLYAFEIVGLALA
ncbi:MAG: respiratory nitrate reductase subunit gamma, partial [Zetaproteobacteria bacterium]|nr:respiratory nitrate reductase subunit gamma [Zetaproteobacteria bacterium]